MEFFESLDWSPLIISLKTGAVATVVSFFLGLFAARKVIRLPHTAKAIVDGILHDLETVDTQGLEMRILHADCLADAESVKHSVLAAHPDMGEIRITSLGVVIGAHCGPGLLAVFYLCNGRQPK